MIVITTHSSADKPRDLSWPSRGQIPATPTHSEVKKPQGWEVRRHYCKCLQPSPWFRPFYSSRDLDEWESSLRGLRPALNIWWPPSFFWLITCWEVKAASASLSLTAQAPPSQYLPPGVNNGALTFYCLCSGVIALLPSGCLSPFISASAGTDERHTQQRGWENKSRAPLKIHLCSTLIKQEADLCQDVSSWLQAEGRWEKIGWTILLVPTVTSTLADNIEIDTGPDWERLKPCRLQDTLVSSVIFPHARKEECAWTHFNDFVFESS